MPGSTSTEVRGRGDTALSARRHRPGWPFVAVGSGSAFVLVSVLSLILGSSMPWVWWTLGAAGLLVLSAAFVYQSRIPVHQPRIRARRGQGSRTGSGSERRITGITGRSIRPVAPDQDAHSDMVSARVSSPTVGEMQQVQSNPTWVKPMIVGTPSPKFEPVSIADGFKHFPFRPDTVVDGWSMGQLAVRGASVRGYFHRYNGAPRQDDFAVHRLQGNRIAVAVADGVSQARQSHIGATTAVRYAVQWLAAQEDIDPDQADWLTLLQGAAWALAEQIQSLASLPQPDPARAEQELACTLVCALLEQTEAERFRAHVVSVGDSGAWLLRDGEFGDLVGGKTVGYGGISSSAVSALPRVPQQVEPTVVEFGAGEVLLIGTDGIGDPLGSGTGSVGNMFRDLLCDLEPPTLLEFARAVDFSRETFDDDRTLVAFRVDRR